VGQRLSLDMNSMISAAIWPSSVYGCGLWVAMKPVNANTTPPMKEGNRPSPSPSVEERVKKPASAKAGEAQAEGVGRRAGRDVVYG